MFWMIPLALAGVAGAAPPEAPTPAQVAALVEETAAVPWNRLSEADWVHRAARLHALVGVEGLDGPARFDLYMQIGRAAENGNDPFPPYYVALGPKTVNHFWVQAAVLANDEPALLKRVDPGQRATLQAYGAMLASGELPWPDPVTPD